MEFGQKHKTAKKEDLIRALPCRNTVKHHVANIANDVRKEISGMMRKAITSERGGLAATTDCWTDDYRHASYMCIVVHMCIEENGQMSCHQYVLTTQEVTDHVKSGTKNFFH